MAACCEACFSCFVLFIVFLSCLVDPVTHCDHLVRERVSWPLCFSLFCGASPFCLGLFAFPLNAIGWLVSVMSVAVCGHLYCFYISCLVINTQGIYFIGFTLLH